MRFSKLLIIAIVMVCGFITTAFASEQSLYDINITPGLQGVIGLIFSVLLGAVGWFVIKISYLVKKYLNINIDDKTRKYLEVAIRNGILYGEKKALEKVGGLKNPQTKDLRIAHAADYVLERVPDAVKHFKLDRKNLVDIIETRLNDGDKNKSDGNV